MRGVIIYYFNEYQGDKPDIGSDVWICNVEDIEGFDIKLCDTFRHATTYRGLAEGYKNMKQKPSEVVTAQLKLYRGDDDMAYKSIDERNYAQLFNLQIKGRKNHSTVDASGSFSFAIKPGSYFVYVKSNNRKNGNATCEILGKVYCKEITVGDGETADVSYRFDQY